MKFSTSDPQTIHARFQLRYPQTGGSGFHLDINSVIPGRGITAIFGHSGSGKTTLLRCIAGLQKVSRGQLSVNGETWQSEQLFLPTHKRPLGYVFQESSLFEHLTAQGNLNFAIKRSDKAYSQALYDKVITLLGIQAILQQKPAQLSGGERQRVAIARALLIQPRLLLMDEPLASLDFARKQEILPYLEKLHSEFDIPVLYVSHSVDEVARLADHILVMDQGRITAQGALADVLSRFDLPLTLGDDTGVVLKGTVVERDTRWHLNRIAFAGGELWVRDGGYHLDNTPEEKNAGDELNQALRIRILARDVSLARESHQDTSILNRLPVTITEIATDTDPAMALVRLQAGASYLTARITRRSAHHLRLKTGEQLWAQIKSVAIVR